MYMYANSSQAKTGMKKKTKNQQLFQTILSSTYYNGAYG